MIFYQIYFFDFLVFFKDLSDHSRALISAYKKYHYHSQDSNVLKETNCNENKHLHQSKQRSLLSQMSKLITTPRDIKKQQQQSDHSPAFMLTNALKPFDNSIYDSNQIHHASLKGSSSHQLPRRTKHT